MKKTLLIYSIFFLGSFVVNAQCAYSGATDFCPDLDASTLVTGVPTLICGTTWGTEHAQVDNMQSNCTYLIEYCGASFNAEIGVYTDGGGSLVAYSASGCGDDPTFNFSPSANGSYEFQMDNEGVCNTASQNIDMMITLVSCTPLGIEENSLNNKISLYPNPSNGKFTLDYKGTDALSRLTIIDVKGKTIQTLQTLNLDGYSASHSINLEHLSKGVYFVKIQSNNAVATKKVVIE